jgi:hypothetical protein
VECEYPLIMIQVNFRSRKRYKRHLQDLNPLLGRERNHLWAFGHALSLLTMIETYKIDLSGDSEIQFVDRDCALEFPGYSVQTIHSVNSVFVQEKR